MYPGTTLNSMSTVGIVLGSLAAGGGAATAIGAIVAARGRQHPPLARSHSHNDYRRRWPLEQALRQGFVSIEADVFPIDGELLVGHDPPDLQPGQSLRRLYLEPLARRVARDGQALAGSQSPLQLLVEIKQDPATACALLDAELRRYPTLFTSYRDGVAHPGAVSVVVTGRYPRAQIAAQRDRLMACDGGLADIGSGVTTDLVPLVSTDWRQSFRWRGSGPMPAEQRTKLHQLVGDAHADGRQIRFWGTPRWPARARRAVWHELVAARVDYVNADDLASLRRFLRRAAT